MTRRYAIDEMMDNLGRYFKVDSTTEIICSWDVGSELVQKCASHGLPTVHVEFPGQDARSLDFWESFYLMALRYAPIKGCRLMVRAYPDRLAWQILLVKDKAP